MTEWKQIKNYAHSKYKLTDDEEGYFSLIWRFNSGRREKIFVHRFTAFKGMEWIEFRSVVCPGDKIPHKVALEENAKFACGAFGLDRNGNYIFIYNAPLSTMQVKEFELPLHVIAATADKFEKEYLGEDNS